MNKSITRRILAIFIIVTSMSALVYLTLLGDAEARTALITTLSLVTGFYFGVKMS
uniref:Uncharacterized protein n=1 Tax=viral metagenome TaxID=1070528 RepID=A0A6M3J4E5_9ZZZZ